MRELPKLDRYWEYGGLLEGIYSLTYSIVHVDWSDGTDEAIREVLIDALSEALAAPG